MAAIVTRMLGDVSVIDGSKGHELVVADDGSIPADQVRRLGFSPGTHLRVLEDTPARSGGSLAGTLPDFPELSWEDFERASEVARRDARAS